MEWPQSAKRIEIGLRMNSVTIQKWLTYGPPSSNDNKSASVRRSVWHDLGLAGTAQRAPPSLELEASNWLIL